MRLFGTVLLAALLSAGCSESSLRAVPPDVNPADITECGFTPISAMSHILRYDCNPVFSATDEDWPAMFTTFAFNHTTVLGHAFYQLWYLAYTSSITLDGNYQVGYAISSDGTDWVPQEANPLWPEPDLDAWDGDRAQGLFVDWDSSLQRYVAMYGGINFSSNSWGIGIGTSPDGIDWELSDRNPVVDITEEANGVTYCWPLSFSANEGTFDAYLAGFDDALTRHCDMWRVRTDDLDDWDPDNSLVLRSGASGAWDDEGFLSASTVEHDGVQYLFYVGFGTWIDNGTSRSAANSFLGLAVSHDDGTTWDKVSEDPLPVNLTEDGNVATVAARVVGSRIHLWIGDTYSELGTGAVGYYLFLPEEAGL